MTARIAMIVLAAFFLVGLTCDEKESIFFELIGGGTVPGTGDITGTVTVDGSGRSGVAVTLRNSAGQVVATDVTDGSGNYGFNVDPGSYTVSVASPSGTTCSPAEKPATVTENQTTDVDFGCTTPQPTTGTVTGQILVGTSPASGVTVQLRSGATVVATTTTNLSGNYTFSNVNAGSYTVRMTRPNNAASCDGTSTNGTNDKPATVTANQTTTVNFACQAQQQSTVPTTAQNAGSWNFNRTRTSTTGSCTPALAGTGTGTMAAQSATNQTVTGLDPDVPLAGTYNPSTGAYTGSGSTVLGNGFTINTTLNATFSFDASQNPRYTDLMVRMHSFGGSTVCTENYVTTGSRATPSSARFKLGVTSLLPDGVTLFGLRPVSFRYLAPYGDPGAPQIGLIAEEVARVYPGAVMLDAAARPEAIWYGALNGLVLEEIESRVGHAVGTGIARLAEALE